MKRATRSSNNKSSAAAAAPRSRRQAANDASSDSTELASENGEWAVRSIKSKQVDESGDVRYLVDWEGWSGPPTWEPAENCRDCPKAIKEFEAKVARRKTSLSSDRSVTPRNHRGQSGNNNNNSSSRTSRRQATYRTSGSGNYSEGSNSPDKSSPNQRSASKSFKRTPDKTYRTTRRA